MNLKKLDPKNVFSSTGMLAKQCQQIWENAKEIRFADEYENIENIVLCAMGGSAYGGYVANSLFKDQLIHPLVSNNDYALPAFANQNTLVILSSYSGNTEEVLFCAEEAKKREAKIAGIAGGGKLVEFLTANNFPSLIFDPKYNPSGQPRLGTGYIVLGTLGIFNKLGYISISDEEVAEVVDFIKTNKESIKNQAKEIAKRLEGYIPLLIAAEHLNGNIHILRNQINETAKSFAAFAELPELNHHLMEGLKNPTDKKMRVLFINSDLYSDKLKKRLEITKDVVTKNGVSSLEFIPSSEKKLLQVFEVISFGSYLSFYLAMLYGQDPSVIPWVDYFKEQMEKK